MQQFPSSLDCAELGLFLDQLGPAKASVMPHLDLEKLAAIEKTCVEASDVVNLTILVRSLDAETRETRAAGLSWEESGGYPLAGCQWDVTMTPQRLPSPRCDVGGPRSGRSPTLRRIGC